MGEREMNETERELYNKGKQRLRRITIRCQNLFPDQHARGTRDEINPITQKRQEFTIYSPEWQVQEEAVKKTEGARRVYELLNELRNKLTPAMCRAEVDDVRIDDWGNVDVDEETLVYFPSNHHMASGRFVPLPETPEGLFSLLEDYQSGAMASKQYSKSSTIRRNTSESGTLDWMKKMRTFIKLVRSVDDLETLMSMVRSAQKGGHRSAAHISTFAKNEMNAGVTLDGKHVFVGTEFDNRSLHLISENALRVSSEKEFADFLHKSANHVFFNISSRIESKSIVRKAISERLAEAATTIGVDRLAHIVEKSDFMRKDADARKQFTPQVQGLIRHSFEKRKADLQAQ